MNVSNIKIVSSTANDNILISRIVDSAFETIEESKLVFDLLEDKTAMPVISLIAYSNNIPVGHILFTRARIEGKRKSPLMHILAPMAIIPDYQQQGIGKQLISAGLQKLKEINSELVFVLGHMDYYPKAGFLSNAAKHGFLPTYDIKKKYWDIWMVLELKKGALEKYNGKIICADELNKEKYWKE